MSLTEARNPATAAIDRLSTLDMLRLINREDARVAPAVAAELEVIARAVDAIAERMRRGGRLIYVGAGTSGRLGVLDASECPPTFSTAPGQVIGLIAGGPEAIVQSVESAEDDAGAGAAAVADAHVTALDSVIGIAASGRTPFVLGALAEARRRGALAISLACSHPAPTEELAEIAIAPLVGAEVIAGSTRLKAGTAQKLVLNMLSTATMIRLGKTYGNLMVDVQPTNQKLRLRAVRIVAEAAGLDLDRAAEALTATDGEVKTAILAGLAGLSVEDARQRLAEAGGVISHALEASAPSSSEHPAASPPPLRTARPPLLLGIDGGGTKTVALLADQDGRLLGRGQAGASNYQSFGLEAAWSALSEAVQGAFDDAGLPQQAPNAVCLGLAGVDRPEDIELYRQWAIELLPGAKLTIVNDAELVLAAGTPQGWGLAVICGTGSIVIGRSADGRQARADGWGYILGDDGSGYFIGREALRAVARAADGRGPQTMLTAAVLAHWSLREVNDLFRRIYQEETMVPDIARLARLVEEAAGEGDRPALQILERAGGELALTAHTVVSRLRLGGAVPCALAGSVITKGAVARSAFLAAAQTLGLRLDPVEPVAEPAQGAVRLAQRLISL